MPQNQGSPDQTGSSQVDGEQSETGTELNHMAPEKAITPENSTISLEVSNPKRRRRPFNPHLSTESTGSAHVIGGGGLANTGIVQGDINIFNGVTGEDRNLELARSLFRKSLHDRDNFISQFLQQALKQAGTTFLISVIFMTIGGVLVLFAGAMALVNADSTPTTNYLLLAAGLSGLVVGAAGAAFARRADKARKHLADQADAMHDQLLDERKFVQAGELLAGIKDANLNDQARVALALKLLGAEPPAHWMPSEPVEAENKARNRK